MESRPPSEKNKGRKEKKMKNILFRGKTNKYDRYIEKGSWIYGDYVNLKDGTSILPYIYGVGEVCRDTVGQYTGVDDKNGKKLFEGDVVKFISEDSVEIHALCVYDVDLLQFAFETKFSYYTFSDIVSRYDQGLAEKFEIIGNIFDNPELVNWEVDFIENK